MNQLVLPTQDAPGALAATHLAADVATPVQPRKNTPPIGIRRVNERDFVQAIDRWLEGGPWECADAAYRPWHGVNVRLRERGEHLINDGVPIVSRMPTLLHELPSGTRTSNRVEARALAAVAVRGDAGRYDGKPCKALG